MDVGLPIIIDGIVVGGIGVGGAHRIQDIDITKARLEFIKWA